MMGWLIYRKKDARTNDSYIQWFIEEAEKQGISLQLVYREQLTIGVHCLELNQEKTTVPDFVIVRTIEPLLQLQFEHLKIPVFNDFRTAQICNHKAYTYIEMEQLGIPMLQTTYIAAQAPPEILPFSFPFVLKEASGRGGSGVYLIENETQWHNLLWQADDKAFIAQSTDKVQLGKDVRVFVIGKRIIAAVLRSNSTDFRANFKLGGTASAFHLTPVMKKMIDNIIDHFNFGLVGIDFLVNHEGELIFNEIEDVVGSRILSVSTDINLLESYITHIKESIQSS